MRKGLVLAYVDSMRTDMLELAVREGEAPTFAKLLRRGVLVPDCVSSFPSVTPVASAEIVTGVASDSHWISAMNWYHRLERRYVEYGSSFEATRAFGLFRALYDLVYNMNLAHLSPEVETVFEQLDDAGLRTACTPFLIYRGRHRHEVSLEGLMRRAVDVSGLKLRHATWGPKELFYGDLYASRRVPCRPTSRPGTVDEYSACCAAELAGQGLFDFLLLSLPDNDHYSHRHGPDSQVDSIAAADRAFANLVEAAGGLDGFLTDYALVLMADHAQTPVHRELSIIADLSEQWSVLQPSEDRPEGAQLAVSPTARAANVYLLSADGSQVEHDAVREAVEAMEGADVVAHLAVDGAPLVRAMPGPPPPAAEAVVRRAGTELRFRPGDAVTDLRGGGWELGGDPAALDLEIAKGRARSESYPDALARLWSALSAPHAGDLVVSATPGYECVDWGGTSHVGGGSHGSLHRSDSLGPLLFCGCGPQSPGEREQWSLRDVAPIVLEHFGLKDSSRTANERGAGVSA
jgi:predicted AlkP superfamily pyrophosphatase or phosphodiesterase